MKSTLVFGVVLFGLASLFANAAALPAENTELIPRLDSRGTSKLSAFCAKHGNTPGTRQCWTPGFTAETDTTTSWPKTGVIRNYDFHIQNTTCSPDGSNPRVCILINGQIRPPTIVANWGDTIRVTVHNELQSNGTSIHWHGLRMLNNNLNDGVNGITECALAPGDSKTYEFTCTEYGTTWFHSHFGAQMADGLVGTIQINGPATADYDVDLGVMPISDWFYTTAFQTSAIAMQNGQKNLLPPFADNILVNGTAKNAQGGGAWNRVTIEKGKKYRLRLVNTASDANMIVSLDGHPFLVIANDFVAIEPYRTTHLQIAIGQRYDVVITADQLASNYWFRAQANSLCSSSSAREGRAIFNYQGQPVADPTSTAESIPFTECGDPITTPKVPIDVESRTFQSQAKDLPVMFGPVKANHNTLLWTINGTSMAVDHGHPTFDYIAKGINIPKSYNVVRVPLPSKMVYWIIQQDPHAIPIDHPIHPHGHDFFLLGKGKGQFDPERDFGQLKFMNPTRRDVAILPASGWLAIAYPADNPGVWLMHCHISTHVGMGFSVQILEHEQQIKFPDPSSEWYRTCKNWNEWRGGSEDVWGQSDSGL
ncbi:SufI multicopper oxidase [Pyrenophora tritici-repentis]|uniref:laccase n=3 Tax=Pyrenophora tritici-repentis TaxID=45151 RepID=A0A2W1D8F1_9PLEO|nr:laccase-1 precursor [Pyrenophora tritici-repentis Pt-1C-BFP]KAA8627023.1 Laccase [Pyrenophora tritici-repentis]EDU41729.1 laccase-1 precursor [Pyrenophora tritici-repentis Pt-1C-BFP]KAG9389207.1 Laccase [Pyrenophora tritici-repentis]KAI0576281.1 Laccase [Pyrenophora tritici-repentis]KAI1517673.1 Laccase [Pyrenophora tritici-repentis]